jgi:secondary thiamine-phosphate synthase enzyme
MEIKTTRKEQFIDITAGINSLIRKAGVSDGLCNIYVPHTTAAVTINEGADPSVVDDVLMQLNTLVPENNAYTHAEGNSAAHIKSILVGASKMVPVAEGSLQLGTWQKIFFCEFDGPRHRKVFVKLLMG